MLQIEEGKYYRARNGKKIGPMSRIHGADGADRFKWGWCDEDDQPNTCTDDGRYYAGVLSHLDLIAEWVDEAPAVDLTKIDKPFGLLDEATRVALRAYKGDIDRYYGDGGWLIAYDPEWHSDIVYRARPQPPQPAKPREVWINEYGAALSGTLGRAWYPSKEAAEAHGTERRRRTICFREVL